MSNNIMPKQYKDIKQDGTIFSKKGSLLFFTNIDYFIK